MGLSDVLGYPGHYDSVWWGKLSTSCNIFVGPIDEWKVHFRWVNDGSRLADVVFSRLGSPAPGEVSITVLWP